MAPRMPSNHEEWVEVRFIDGYALFMGYLSMAVRGLGFLVVTWTSVVLLGGFVSMLNKKDFWCLTVIILAQTAGVFNVRQNEQLSYIWKSCRVFLGSMYIIIIGRGTGKVLSARKLAGAFVVVVKVLAFAMILCPLCALYMCGLYVNAAISLWRLIQHDFHSADGDPNKANMNPALDVLYSLALVQGLLFGYKEILAFTEKKLVKVVVKEYGFQEQAAESVSDYLSETKMGCAKDPTFSRGRNLVTYAVDLLDSKSPDSYISGARILDTIIRRPEMFKQGNSELIKHLLASASSSHILQKLLRTLDSRSPCDREIRMAAASIVAHLAGNLRLQQFSRGIQCVSSLLETCLEEDAKATDHKDLLYQGLRIIGKLAIDEENCRVMSNNSRLISKITAPVNSDLLHRCDHEEWSSIVDASLQAMWQLVIAPGEAGTRVSAEISGNKKAIETMETIVDCPECAKVEERHTLAVKILAHTANDESRGSFIVRLVNIFTDKDRGNEFRGLAGESLAALSFDTKSSMIILDAKGYVIAPLFQILEEVGHKKNRILSARILEGLCSHCNKDDRSFKYMKAYIAHTMPRVLREIVISEPRDTGKDRYSTRDIDVEGQHRGGGYMFSSSRCKNNDEQQNDERKLQVALLSLCSTACNKHLLPFDRIAGIDDTFSFAKKISSEVVETFHLQKEDTVEPNIGPKADCLKILKHTMQIAISMIESGSQHVDRNMESLVKSVSDASKCMLAVDGLMLFSGDQHTTKPVKTLTELLKDLEH